MDKEILVSQLSFDQENPRHDVLNNEQNIINILLEKEKVEALAVDIIKERGLSPLEQIGVFEFDKDKYIVLEGNRRLCALKLISNPLLAPKKLQDKFYNLHEQAIKENLLPFKVRCYVFEDREDSREWLIKRHGGEQKGVGTKSWDPQQSQRFTKKPSYNLAISLIEHAKKYKLVESGDLHGVISTVTRTFSTPVVRYEFGIKSNVSDELVEINVSVNDFNRILKKYFADLLDMRDLRISSRSTKEQRIEYIDSLKESGHLPLEKQQSSIFLNDDNNDLPLELTDDPNDKNTQNIENQCNRDNFQSDTKLNAIDVTPKSDVASESFSDLVESNTIYDTDTDTVDSVRSEDGMSQKSMDEDMYQGETDSDTSTPTKIARLSNPHSRKYLINSTYNLTSAPIKLKKIYSELKNTLSVQDTPYAVSTLFRVFLELSCDYYFAEKYKSGLSYNNYPNQGKSGKASEKSSLDVKVVAIAQTLCGVGKITDKELAAITSVSAEPKSISAGGSLTWLHSCVHNYAHSINPPEIINAYENYSCLLAAIWSEL